MSALLPETTAELDRWKEQNLTLPLWWRDDDAIEPTPALDRLLGLAERFEAPMHLAVIPKNATQALAEGLKNQRGVVVLTHGWAHANHAPKSAKKAEFGNHRPTQAMLDEVAAGSERLRMMFGDQALPIFTPPWNRIATEVAEGLAATGMRALSTFTPRRERFAADGLLQVNTQLDPIAWKTGGGLLDPSFLDAHLSGQLWDRRTGEADNAEPYGILTHHLVHDDATWDFVEMLVDTITGCGVARWTSPLYELGGASPSA